MHASIANGECTAQFTECGRTLGEELTMLGSNFRAQQIAETRHAGRLLQHEFTEVHLLQQAFDYVDVSITRERGCEGLRVETPPLECEIGIDLPVEHVARETQSRGRELCRLNAGETEVQCPTGSRGVREIVGRTCGGAPAEGTNDQVVDTCQLGVRAQPPLQVFEGNSRDGSATGRNLSMDDGSGRVWCRRAFDSQCAKFVLNFGIGFAQADRLASHVRRNEFERKAGMGEVGDAAGDRAG